MTAGANSTQSSAMAARFGTTAASGESEWRLPSGDDLIAFALATGFAAGPLAEMVTSAGRSDRWTSGPTPGCDRVRRP